MTTWKIWIPGAPRPQQRPKANARGPHVRIYYPETPEMKAWLASCDHAFSRLAGTWPITGPVGCLADCILPRPQDDKRDGWDWAPVAGRLGGDWDNLGKPLTDRMESMGLIENDSRICDGRVRKVYGPKDQPVGCFLRFWTLDASPALERVSPTMGA